MWLCECAIKETPAAELSPFSWRLHYPQCNRGLSFFETWLELVHRPSHSFIWRKFKIFKISVSPSKWKPNRDEPVSDILIPQPENHLPHSAYGAILKSQFPFIFVWLWNLLTMSDRRLLLRHSVCLMSRTLTAEVEVVWIMRLWKSAKQNPSGQNVYVYYSSAAMLWSASHTPLCVFPFHASFLLLLCHSSDGNIIFSPL